MLKITAIPLFALAMTTSAFANDKVYVKGGIGINTISTSKFSNHDFDGKVTLKQAFPLVELGVGYYFTDTIRAEAVIDYYFLFRTRENSFDKDKDSCSILSKTKANAYMLNIYKDVFTYKSITPFVGAGIGLATLKEQASGHVLIARTQHDLNLPTSKKIHKKLAYKITAGADIKFDNSPLVAEVSYNYFNLGKHKNKSVGGINNVKNRNYAIHNITLGIRVGL